jgi:hypothetical protein
MGFSDLWDTGKEFGAYLVDSGASLVGANTTFAADQYIKDNTDPTTGFQMGIVNTPATNADFRLNVAQGEQKTLAEQKQQAKDFLGSIAGLLGISAGILAAGAVVGGLIYLSATGKLKRWVP